MHSLFEPFFFLTNTIDEAKRLCDSERYLHQVVLLDVVLQPPCQLVVWALATLWSAFHCSIWFGVLQLWCGHVICHREQKFRGWISSFPEYGLGWENHQDWMRGCRCLVHFQPHKLEQLLGTGFPPRSFDSDLVQEKRLKTERLFHQFLIHRVRGRCA